MNLSSVKNGTVGYQNTVVCTVGVPHGLVLVDNTSPFHLNSFSKEQTSCPSPRQNKQLNHFNPNLSLNDEPIGLKYDIWEVCF